MDNTNKGNKSYRASPSTSDRLYGIFDPRNLIFYKLPTGSY